MPLTLLKTQIELLLFKGVPRFEPHQTASGQSVFGAEVFNLGKEHCNVTVILACDATLVESAWLLWRPCATGSGRL